MTVANDSVRNMDSTHSVIPHHNSFLVLAGFQPVFDVEFILLMVGGAVAVLALILSIAALCRVKQGREMVNQR